MSTNHVAKSFFGNIRLAKKLLIVRITTMLLLLIAFIPVKMVSLANRTTQQLPLNSTENSTRVVVPLANHVTSQEITL